MSENYTGLIDLTIDSDKACPKEINHQDQEKKPGSIIGGFMTSFFILTALYFILGAAYNISANKSNHSTITLSYRIP